MNFIRQYTKINENNSNIIKSYILINNLADFLIVQIIESLVLAQVHIFQLLGLELYQHRC